MDMRQLKYFAQIVESGSLAKASRQLFIAQPALSQQMARLDGEVGKALLVRSSRGVVPTENGEALYHHAKFMLRQMEQAVAVARQETEAVNGRVALGLAPTTVCQVGLPLILPSPGYGLRRRIALEFERINQPLDAVAEIDSLPLLMSCVARGMGATIKPMAAIHALGDTPQRWRWLRISNATMTRTNYLYALPPQKLSPCAAVVRDELKGVVRQLVESGAWQGVALSVAPPAASDGAEPRPRSPPEHAEAARQVAFDQRAQGALALRRDATRHRARRTGLGLWFNADGRVPGPCQEPQALSGLAPPGPINPP